MLIVCADDFGQNAAISLGILQLLAQKRLDAVSCMVTQPACQVYAKSLLVYQPELEIGLHLDLTHGKTSLLKVIAQAYRLWPCDRSQLRKNIREQILGFHQLFGRWPDFIDGHQHVHQLPLVADLLLEVVQELGITPWFRRTYVWGGFAPIHLKKLALCSLGGHRFAQKIKQLGYTSNLNFSGDYNFSPTANYREIFIKALDQVKGDGLIMCHPGLASDDRDDPIRSSRSQELAYFASQQYLDDRI